MFLVIEFCILIESQVKIGGVGLDSTNSMPNLEGCAKDISLYGSLVSELLAPYGESDRATTSFIKKCTQNPVGKTAARLLNDRFFNEISCDDQEEEENNAIPRMVC